MGAVWLAIELEREFGVEPILTERELRAIDAGRSPQPVFAARLGRDGDRAGLHFPDFLVREGGPEGKPLAVELERTVKRRRRLERIVRAYRDAHHLGQVRYYATEAAGRAVRAAVAATRANAYAEVIDVRPWNGRAFSTLAPLLFVFAAARDKADKSFGPSPELVDAVVQVAAGLFAAAIVLLAVGRFRWPERVRLWPRLRWTWAPVLALPAGIAAALFGSGAPWLYGVTAGSLIAAYALWEGERDDFGRGGKFRRRTRSRVGPVQIVERVRARRAIRSDPLGAVRVSGARAFPRFWRRQPAGIALGEDLRGFPQWLRFSQITGHGLILGATGSGKTNSELWLLTRLLRAGHGVVLIDCKGDPDVAERLRAEAERLGRPFFCWRIEGGTFYNPLLAGTPSSRRDKLVSALGHTFRDSPDYFRGLFSDHSLQVLRALEALKREPSLAGMRDIWRPDELEAVGRGIVDEETRNELGRYGAEIEREGRREIMGLLPRIREITDSGAGKWLSTGGANGEAIDIYESLNRRDVVVFSLNSSEYEQTARGVGNLIAQDIVSACGRAIAQGQRFRAAFALDEFSRLRGEPIAGLMALSARRAGLAVVLATQEFADLRSLSPEFESQVVGNCNWFLGHQQNVPDSSRKLADIAGTEEVPEQTRQIDRRWSFGDQRQLESETGLGSESQGRAWVIHPDEWQALERGWAGLVRKNPCDARVVRVYRCEDAASVGDRSKE